MYLLHDDRGSPGRVSPFGYRRIDGYLLLPAAFRSLSRPSSAPGAKASSLCSSSLDLLVRIALRTFQSLPLLYFASVLCYLSITGFSMS